MESIDKEIEIFKTNLLTIDKLTKEIEKKNQNIEELFKDVSNLEQIKKDLKEEIKSLQESNSQTNETCKNLSNDVDNILKSLEDFKTLYSNEHSKLKYLVIVNLALVVLTIIILLLK